LDKYKYWFHSLPMTSDATFTKLLNKFKSPEAVYDAVIKQNQDLKDILDGDIRIKNRATAVIEYTGKYDLEREYEILLKKNIKMVTYDEADYPRRLKAIPNPPYGIYYKGILPEEDTPSVAIIGARDCSEYGTFTANAFGESLAKEGVNIISGMARGIDGIGQRGALNANGRTYAVLGCGVDVCYPQGNIKLYNEIIKTGGVLSTFPPGTGVLKRNFPERNRIVAGLADLVLVIEARQKSGTFITVDIALKQGKDVYAIPGRLTDRLSDGCNMLIREGAGVALSPEDILRELGVIWKREHPNSEKLNQNYISTTSKYIPPEDTGVLKYLDIYPKSIEEIHNARLEKEASVSVNQTMSELIMLAADGKVIQIGSGYFYKTII